MTNAPVHLLILARAAALAGYAAVKVRALIGAARRRNGADSVRTVEVEGVRLNVPVQWGDVERDGLGRLVIHNRPSRFRVDGDAVWYSSAVELRILPGRFVPARNAEAMTVTRRFIPTCGEGVTLELALANGMGAAQRAAAEAVLATAAPAHEGSPATKAA